MDAWRKEIVGNTLGEQIGREYRNLLAVGKKGDEAEAVLIDYFHSQFPDDELTMGRFWMALALCEWEFGRLTQKADCNARRWAMHAWTDISKTATKMLLQTLDQPMPACKKVRLPPYISHCPWPVGSLLAYRIISSDHPHVTQSPLYKKYVLLRIIQIKKLPVTQLAPNDAWDERMLVGLYNWIGDTIPDPKIVDSLQFTAVSVHEPMLPASVFQHIPMMQNGLDSQLLTRTTEKRVETCCDLSWKCGKRIKTADVFTYLGCDSAYAQDVPSFFRTGVCDYAMCSCLAFDADLVNRFTQLAEEADRSVLS